MRKIKLLCPPGYVINIELLTNYILLVFGMSVSYNILNGILILNGMKYDQAVAWIRSNGIIVEEIAQ
jgi:hypothetical protein